MALRPCLACGLLTDQTRCSTCRSAQQRARDQVRGSSAQRGYGADHRARRSAMLPTAYGKPCARCGLPVLPGQALDLDHMTPVAHGGRDGQVLFSHSACNRRAGGKVRRRR